MASTVTLFNSFRKYIADGTIDLDSDTIKAALLLDTYTVNPAHTILSDVSSHEAGAGSGYSSGGVALTGKSVTYTGTTGKFTSDPPLWLALTKTFRFLLVYAAVTRNSIVNPLIEIILIDNTPQNIIVSAADYSIQWSANGILSIN